MSYCLNPSCKTPDNRAPNNFCIHCGKKLLLRERYRALKPIGQGGFGKTFLGVDEDKPTKPPCVIKQFSPSSQGTNNLNKATDLFNQEAVRLDSLGKHDQIPELLAHFEQDQLLYIVQEYVEGQNLAQELQQNGVLNETQIQDLLTQLLTVLDFVHQNNVIHRDIKPENIIKRADGKYVLVDFGAARYVTGTALLKTGTIIGDPRYMSGEQLQGKAVFASDLYSLGLTCLHLLTNIEPWDLFDHGNDQWVWRDYLTQSVNQRLGQILDKMVVKAINNRFQSAREILNILNPHKTSSNNTVAPPNPLQPQVKPQVKLPTNTPTQKSNKPPVNPPPVIPNVTSAVNLKPIKLGGNKHGYIDATGKVVIEPQFEDAKDFSEGLAAVKINDKYGYIDETGNIVIQPQFYEAENFDNGFAKIITFDNSLSLNPFSSLDDPFSFSSLDDPFSSLDPCSRKKINKIGHIFDDVGNFYEGLAWVKIDGKYGYIDEIGNMVIKLWFDGAENFLDGLAKIQIDNKYGFIDQTGKIVIQPQFDGINNFSNGVAIVTINAKYGFIDQTGNIVIQPQFDDADDFSEGLAIVTINGKYGFIDQTGNIVIQPQFSNAGDFSEGLAIVNINDKYGFVDQTGNIVIQPQFSKAGDFNNGKAQVEIKGFLGFGGKKGYINKKGEWIN